MVFGGIMIFLAWIACRPPPEAPEDYEALISYIFEHAGAETDEELLHSDFAPSGTAGLSGRHLGDCLRDEIGAVVKLTRER